MVLHIPQPGNHQGLAVVDSRAVSPWASAAELVRMGSLA